MSQRRKFTPELKAKVALETLKNEKTVAEIAKDFQLHQSQVTQWKKEAKDHMPVLFKDKRVKDTKVKEMESDIALLERKVGQLTMERDFLKKTSEILGLATEVRL